MSTAAHDRFEHVVTTLGPRVLGYLARRSPQPADAADRLAEVLVIAWRRIEDVPEADDQALPWLLAVARRVSANHTRGTHRHAALVDRLREEVGRTAGPEDPGDDTLEVGEALATLADADREVITLIAWEGLSPAEAAVVLGISPAAARKRLQRARDRLRPLLPWADPLPVASALSSGDRSIA